MMTAITAHRGFSARYPENTLLAFRQAVQAGANRLELDVHASADHQVVVHHGYTWPSTFPSEAWVSETSTVQIQTFRYQGESIPLLPEVFAEFGATVEYELELKGVTSEFLTAVLSVVNAATVGDHVEFTSPHSSVLAALQARKLNVKLGFFVSPFPTWMSEALGLHLLVGNLRLGGFQVAHCPVEMVTARGVDTLHQAGFLVSAADCNTEASLRHAFAVGVDHLSTDEVELARTLRVQVQGA